MRTVPARNSGVLCVTADTHGRHRTVCAAAGRRRLRVEAGFGADPEQYIGQNAVTGCGEPNHGGAYEAGEQSPPNAVRQEQYRPNDNIDPDRYIDAPLEIPAVSLQEIELAAHRCFGSEHGGKAEQAQHIADRAEARQRDIDGDETRCGDPENPKRIDQQGQRCGSQQNETGDQPDGPLDIPAVRRDNIDA